MWFSLEMARKDQAKRDLKASMVELLEQHKCASLDELVAKGKAGEIGTEFPVQNWDTLLWTPKALAKAKRKAIPVGLWSDNLNYEFAAKRQKAPRYLQILSFVVPPTAEDPNIYSLQYHFESGNSVFLGSGVEEVKRLLDCGVISGMSNGVVGHRLSAEDKYDGIHYGAIRAFNSIRACFTPPAST